LICLSNVVALTLKTSKNRFAFRVSVQDTQNFLPNVLVDTARTVVTESAQQKRIVKLRLKIRMGPRLHQVGRHDSKTKRKLGRKITVNTTNNDLNPAVLQSVVEADLHRVTLVSKARRDAENGLPTLTKAELAELLFEQFGSNKQVAKEMVETFFNEIGNALERGEDVKLSCFGNFQVRDKVARPGRNPKTGAAVIIAARRVVTFQASQKVKNMVEGELSLARAD
jgi:integration host factor subunit alpha